MINSTIIITTAMAAPAIVGMGNELLDEELVDGELVDGELVGEELVGKELLRDGVGCSVTITQSGELNESSIAGQLGSMSRVTEAIVIDAEDSTQFDISLTTSSAVITEAEACTVTLALNTTVFSKFPCDPRQLKLSLAISNVQEHLGVISSITVDIMSSNF